MAYHYIDPLIKKADYFDDHELAHMGLDEAVQSVAAQANNHTHDPATGETAVISVVNEAALPVVTVDGQMAVTKTGNIYTAVLADGKWAARTGNKYDTPPAWANVIVPTGTIAAINLVIKRWTGTAWANHLRPGDIDRPTFTHVDSTNISVGGGGCMIKNAGWIDWPQQQVQFPLAGTGNFNYVYATTDQALLASKTVPVWDDTWHGWYNQDDRCIGIIRGPSSFSSFHCSDGMLVHGSISDAFSIAPSNTGLEVTLSIPDIARTGLVTIKAQYINSNNSLLWRPAGQIGSIRSVSVGQTSLYGTASIAVPVGTAKQILLIFNGITQNLVTVYTNGYMFPEGM